MPRPRSEARQQEHSLADSPLAGPQGQNGPQNRPHAGGPSRRKGDADESGRKIAPSRSGAEVKAALRVERGEFDRSHQGQAEKDHHQAANPSHPVGPQEAAQAARRRPQRNENRSKADHKGQGVQKGRKPFLPGEALLLARNGPPAQVADVGWHHRQDTRGKERSQARQEGQEKGRRLHHSL